MGEYFLVANLDKKEFYQARFLKMSEMIGNNDGRVLLYLLSRRWAGDRIVVAGDSSKFSELYSEAVETWKDISHKAYEECDGAVDKII